MCGLQICLKISVFVVKRSVFVKWIELNDYYLYTVLCINVSYSYHKGDIKDET